MALDGITGVPNALSGEARTRLSDNYDSFLVLLTAQLQNQDPLAPMDSTQFTQQLVQFSQVEQQIRTNEQLEGLVGQYQAASAGAALAYLGRDAIIQGSGARVGEEGGANWGYAFERGADDVKITVRDSRNRVVYETAGERSQGDHLFTWDGLNSDGEHVEAGIYRISVTAKDSAGEVITPRITTRETILGVDFSGPSPMVITQSGSHGLDTVRAIIDGT